ncbi:MAG: DUF1326 domain-containing protein [Terracidiphilus sp.]
MGESWHVSGHYLESCNCKPACPCIFLSPPTEGVCGVVVGWHIDSGKFGGVDLAELNVALAVDSPGVMHEVPWKAALYLDVRASEEQKNGLMTIFSGQGGGHPARLAGHIGEVLGVASVPIDFEREGKHARLKVGEVAEVDIETMTGAGGAEIAISGHPLCIAPGFPAVLAKSKSLRYEDHGYKWILSDRNGLHSPFAYQN